MSGDDITQIKVGSASIGIRGLESVLQETAETYKDKPDAEVMRVLVDRLGRKNYISEKAVEEYANAFLREFRKFLGQPFEDASGGFQIKVLGPGCAQCDRLAQELQKVMAQTGIIADLEHVRDIREIGRYGVMGTPALVINGEVKSVGAVPSQAKLRTWLEQAAKR